MKRLVLSLVTLTAITALFWLHSPVSAADPARCAQKDSTGTWVTADCNSVSVPSIVNPGQCATLSTSNGRTTPTFMDCSKFESLVGAAATSSVGCPKTATVGLNLDCSGGKNPIYALLEFAINWIIRLLTVLAVVMVVVSGIQYITSQGNPEGIKGAKSRLTNAIVGLILLALMFVILNLLGI